MAASREDILKELSKRYESNKFNPKQKAIYEELSKRGVFPAISKPKDSDVKISLSSITESAGGFVRDAALNQIKKQARIGEEVYGGLIKGAGGLSELAAKGVETMYDSGRAVAEIGMRMGGKTDLPPFEKTNYLSDNLRKATEEMTTGRSPIGVNLPPDEQRSFDEKVVGLAAEYAGATAALTRQGIEAGAKLLKDPTKISTGIKGYFQKAQMAAAQNPAAQKLLEQQYSALVATVGTVAKEMGASPNEQLVAEIVTGLASGTIVNKSGDIASYIKSKSSPKAAAKKEVAGYLQSIEAADPDLLSKVARGEELAAKTGIKMDFAELANNPELKAAKKILEVVNSGSSTKSDMLLKEQTKAIDAAFPRRSDTQIAAVNEVQGYRTGVENDLTKRSRNAVESIIQAVDSVAPADRIGAGIKGKEMLEAAKKVSKDNVDALYASVGNPTLPINFVKNSISEASKSALKGNEFMGLLDAHTKALIKKNFTDQKSITLTGLRDFQSHLGQQISDATLAGNAQKVRIYSIMFSGVEKQLDSITGDNLVNKIIKAKDLDPSLNKDLPLIFRTNIDPNLTIKGADDIFDPEALKNQNLITDKMVGVNQKLERAKVDKIEALKIAKAAAKAHYDIYNQGENMLALKTGLQNMDKISPNDFIQVYIKPNGLSKTAQIEDAVGNFYSSIGKTPEAKQYLSNAFGVLLKEQMQSNSSPKAVSSFLSKYSRFINAAGIGDRFATVERAVKQADAANAVMEFDKANFAKSALSGFIKADDPVKAVMGAVEGKTIGKLMEDVSRLPNKARRDVIDRGIKDALWEGLYNKTITTQHVDGVMILNTSNVRQILSKNGAAINNTFGKGHSERLTDLLDTIDRIGQNTAVTRAHGIADKPDEKLTQKLISGIVQASRGFVSPEFVTGQMSYRGIQSLSNKASREMLDKAIKEPELAKALLKLKATPEGKTILKNLFMSVGAPVVSEANDTEMPTIIIEK